MNGTIMRDGYSGTDTLTLSKVFSEKLSTDKKLASEIAVNNADTIAAYIMGVGTENSSLKLEKLTAS